MTNFRTYYFFLCNLYYPEDVQLYIITDLVCVRTYTRGEIFLCVFTLHQMKGVRIPI